MEGVYKMGTVRDGARWVAFMSPGAYGAVLMRSDLVPGWDGKPTWGVEGPGTDGLAMSVLTHAGVAPELARLFVEDFKRDWLLSAKDDELAIPLSDLRDWLMRLTLRDMRLARAARDGERRAASVPPVAAPPAPAAPAKEETPTDQAPLPGPSTSRKSSR